jgi:hypothetical protein
MNSTRAGIVVLNILIEPVIHLIFQNVSTISEFLLARHKICFLFRELRLRKFRPHDQRLPTTSPTQKTRLLDATQGT